MRPVIEHLLSFFQQRSAQAFPDDSRRIFHGRGHCFPGYEYLCVDYFQPVLLITLFKAPPEAAIDDLVAEVKDHFSAADIGAVMVQHRYLQGAPANIVWGHLPEVNYARRGGLRFSLPLAQQQSSSVRERFTTRSYYKVYGKGRNHNSNPVNNCHPWWRIAEYTARA